MAKTVGFIKFISRSRKKYERSVIIRLNKKRKKNMENFHNPTNICKKGQNTVNGSFVEFNINILKNLTGKNNFGGSYGFFYGIDVSNIVKNVIFDAVEPQLNERIFSCNMIFSDIYVHFDLTIKIQILCIVFLNR